jgi:hypothetical protein
LVWELNKGAGRRVQLFKKINWLDVESALVALPSSLNILIQCWHSCKCRLHQAVTELENGFDQNTSRTARFVPPLRVMVAFPWIIKLSGLNLAIKDDTFGSKYTS